LWEIETEGYAEVVDTVGAIAADRQTLGTAVEPFLASDGPADHRYPTIAFGGRPAAAPTSPGPTAGRPGSVLAQHFDRDDGRFAGRVEVNRRAVILVKTSFDPRWEAMVDGKSVSPQMVAPSFVGIPVGPGEHTFELVYRPFRWHLPLIALGALALLAVGHRRSPFAISAPTVNASGVSSL
jgi:hypothetical protein